MSGEVLDALNTHERVMKAFIIDRYSKKGPMRLGEMPSPGLRDDDVLIEVHAAGLNLLDSKIIASALPVSARVGP